MQKEFVLLAHGTAHPWRCAFHQQAAAAYDVLSTKREQYDAGEIRVSDDDDWRDFSRVPAAALVRRLFIAGSCLQASQTYSNSGIEDNVYSWTVFFAIAAMPVAAFVHREWSFWALQRRKARKDQQRIEATALKAEKARQSELLNKSLNKARPPVQVAC
jgi:hypothetical protein